jgi:hypothetical protein
LKPYRLKVISVLFKTSKQSKADLESKQTTVRDLHKKVKEYVDKVNEVAKRDATLQAVAFFLRTYWLDTCDNWNWICAPTWNDSWLSQFFWFCISLYFTIIGFINGVSKYMLKSVNLFADLFTTHADILQLEGTLHRQNEPAAYNE